MKHSKLAALSLGLLAVVASQLGGCPVAGTSAEIIAGSTGDTNRLGTNASVTVLSPVVSLPIAGGAPVEVNWTAVATTNFAVINVIFDLDTDPSNGNEIEAITGLGLTNSTAVLNTAPLEAATYNIGVVLIESNEIAAFAYAPGQLLVNQRPTLTFSSPRGAFIFDRTNDVVPRFDVAWTLEDPDSTVSVQVFLDPDDTPNGNEFLLRESNDQNGDSFSFSLPTASFEPGTYRVLAVVSDAVSDVGFYAPGQIQILARLAGLVDLRDLGTDESPIPGAVFTGFNPRDNAGSLVATLSDYDNDGIDDFAIVSQFGKPRFEFAEGSRTGVGESYFIYGRSSRFSGQINLNSVGALFRGDVYSGIEQVATPIRPSRGITDLTLLADWDRDGVREVAFGLPFVDSQAHPNGFDVAGYFRSGGAVVAAGFNLFPDIAFPGGRVIPLADVGSGPHIATTAEEPVCLHTFLGPKAPTGFGGGGATLFWRFIPSTAVAASQQGCRLTSVEFGDQSGENISRYQFDSIIISSPNRDPSIGDINRLTGTPVVPSVPGAGMVSVFFTQRIGGFPYRTTNAPAGNDIYLGPTEPTFIDSLPQHGPYYYIFDDFRVDPATLEFLTPGYVTDPDNSENPCTLSINPDVPQEDNTFRILGSDEGGRASNAEGIDDFNGDGLEDLMFGYPQQNNGDGAVYIVFGRLRGLFIGGQIETDELQASMRAQNADQRIVDGIRIAGSNGIRLGSTQDAIGDFNGDGLPDIVLGSSLLNDRRGGAVVVYGNLDLVNQTADELTIETLTERGLATTFVGQSEDDFAGVRVAAAGDVDGDSIQDLLIAAPGRSIRADIDLDGVLEIDREDCGVVYLVYGSPDYVGRTMDLSMIGTTELPGVVFVGRNSGDGLGAALGQQLDRAKGIARAGDVDGDGFGDLLLSSPVASPRGRAEAGEAYLIYGAGD